MQARRALHSGAVEASSGRMDELVAGDPDRAPATELARRQKNLKWKQGRRNLFRIAIAIREIGMPRPEFNRYRLLRMIRIASASVFTDPA